MRLYVTVNHTYFVRGIKPFGSLQYIMYCKQWFYWTKASYVILEVLTIDMMHDNEIDIIIVAVIDNPYNMRIIQAL